jgi:hypothetical protein
VTSRAGQQRGGGGPAVSACCVGSGVGDAVGCAGVLSPAVGAGQHPLTMLAAPMHACLAFGSGFGVSQVLESRLQQLCRGLSTGHVLAVVSHWSMGTVVCASFRVLAAPAQAQGQKALSR